MGNLKPWAKVKVPFLQNPFLCLSHRKLAQSVPDLQCRALPVQEAAEGFKCFKNAGVKLRGSLAQFQHKEALVRKERIQVQAQTLQTELQLTEITVSLRHRFFTAPRAQLQLGLSQRLVKWDNFSCTQQCPAVSHAERS